MLRFIVKRKTYSGCTEDTRVDMETIDVFCPELESALVRGGCGGGPNGDDFDRTELVGVEVRLASS